MHKEFNTIIFLIYHRCLLNPFTIFKDHVCPTLILCKTVIILGNRIGNGSSNSSHIYLHFILRYFPSVLLPVMIKLVK